MSAVAPPVWRVDGYHPRLTSSMVCTMTSSDTVELQATAALQDRRRHLTAVLIVYRHRLFRDIVSGLFARSPAIAVVETTSNKENALRLLEDLGWEQIVVIVETETQVSLEQGNLAFMLRATQDDPRIRVIAVTLSGSGISINSWRWLSHLDSDCLLREVLNA
jgi:hypothetical protein